MTDKYETPRLLGQPSKAHSYHTRECRTIKMSKHEPKKATKSLIEWHGLEECDYCSGVYEPDGAANKAILND